MSIFGNAEVTDDIPVDNFERLPDGDYNVVIEEANLKENAEKEWGGISFKLKVTEGDHEGRFVYPLITLMQNGLMAWGARKPDDPKDIPVGAKIGKNALMTIKMVGNLGSFDLSQEGVQEMVGVNLGVTLRAAYNDDSKNDVKKWFAPKEPEFAGPSF